MKIATGNARRDGWAFTLIELMVAIGLFALVMISIYSCWYSVVRSASIGLQAAAAAQRGRVAMRTIEDAVLTAQMYTENARFYSFVADTSEKFAALSLTCRLPGNFPGAGYYGEDQLALRRVTFTVEKGTDNDNQLVMMQMPVLAADSESTEYDITLAHDVTDFSLEFWDPAQRDWTKEFLPTNQLPAMVRITLGLGHNSINPTKPVEVISRVVAPAAVMVTPNYQMVPH